MPALRICTVTDGLDAVLRVAALLSAAGEEASRTDLRLNMAQEALAAAQPGAFDLIVLATGTDGRSPDMLRALAQRAIGLGPAVLLCAPEEPLPAGLPAGLRVLRGPPFPSGSPETILTAALPAAPAPTPPPPLPADGGRGRLGRLLARLSRHPTAGATPLPDIAATEAAATPPRVHVIQPSSGGTGATTFSVNLAVALAERLRPAGDGPAVCLIDLNPQFGSVGSCFDLPENSQLRDAYRNIRRIDAEVFDACLQHPLPGVAVLQTPSEIMPFDALGAGPVGELIALGRAAAPVVVIDMPHCIADWAEQVFVEADRIWCPGALDVRGARNARLLGALLEAAAPACPAGHILTRAPLRRSSEWEEDRAAFETATGRPLSAILPEGGPQVTAAGNAGTPLCRSYPKNPLARQIRAFAARIALPVPDPGKG